MAQPSFRRALSPSEPNHPERRETNGTTRSATLAFALLMGGAASALLLAGRAEQGNLGVYLICAGVAMVACPPRARVHWRAAAIAAAFVGCAALSLLPAHLFPTPEWRRALAGVPDLPLPGTVSAAPGQTLFWLGILAVTIMTGLFALTQPVRSQRLLTFALAGVGFCGVYAAVSIFAKLAGWHLTDFAGTPFGFLPNRNHTATLLVTGSILSAGTLAITFRERRWVAADLAVASLTLCATGLLFFSGSRAGVLFLLGGLAVWVSGIGGAHRSRPLLLAAVVAIGVSVGLFLTVKTDAQVRLLQSIPVFRSETRAAADKTGNPPEPEQGGITNDDRWRIYRDTAGMIREAPWTGSGLGTFALVFPAYRRALLNDSLVLHPESDWLMVAAEMGLPACVCLVLLVVWIFRTWRPERNHPYWPLRWGFVVAAGAALLHGMVDVPIHRAALGWWVLALLGLALQPGRNAAPETGLSSRRLARTLFVLSGVGACLLGGRLVRAEWFGGPALPPYAAKQAQTRILQVYKQGDTEKAMEQARQAVRAFPLVPPLYFPTRLPVAPLRGHRPGGGPGVSAATPAKPAGLRGAPGTGPGVAAGRPRHARPASTWRLSGGRNACANSRWGKAARPRPCASS